MTEEDQKILNEENPLAVLTQTFCDHKYILLVYTIDGNAISFGFRSNIASIVLSYLGKRVLVIDPSWSDKITVMKMMENSNTIDKEGIVNSIISLNTGITK